MSDQQVPVVNKDECTGCGLCSSVYAPAVFVLNDDEGVAEVQKKDDYSEHKEEVDEAIENCPASCISWGTPSGDEE